LGARCKLRSLKRGMVIRQTSVLLKRHSIIVHGATAKRGSANTPKTWKARRPHNVWRSNHAPVLVRHASLADALRDAGPIGAAGHAERLSRQTGGKYQRACSEGVRRAGWTNRLVVEPRAHVFNTGEEPLD